jgi:hypothetical protein
MLRAALIASLLGFLFVPQVLAQEFPAVEISLGYANLATSVRELDPFLANSFFLDDERERHSGFGMHAGLNLTHWLGVENYTGYYSLGRGFHLLINTIGGKLALRKYERATLYGVVAYGRGSLRVAEFGEIGDIFRIGGGVDIPFNESMALKFDVSRMSLGEFISGVGLGDWRSSLNFSTGVVFRVGEGGLW